MKIIKPIPINHHNLISSNIPIDDYGAAAYDAATTYAAGTKVLYILEASVTGLDGSIFYISSHRVYESKVAGNVGNAVSDTDFWLDLGPVNRWKMFDQAVGTQTFSDIDFDPLFEDPQDNIAVVIKPGAINALVLLDCDATEVTITMTDPVEGLVYEETIDLALNTHIVDAYTYFFEPIILKDAVVLLGLPQYANAEIAVTITYASDHVAKCGTLAVGLITDIGATQLSPTVGFDSYSKIERDPFGVMTVLPRGYSKKLSCQLSIPAGSVDVVMRKFTEVKDLPVIWIGVDAGYSSMIVYGIVKSCPITIAYVTHSICNLEIEGFV